MGKSYWIYLCFQDLVSFTVIISAIYTLREKGVEMLTRGVNQATTFKPEFYTLFTILNMNMYFMFKMTLQWSLLWWTSGRRHSHCHLHAAWRSEKLRVA